jgi:hypothetical protein
MQQFLARSTLQQRIVDKPFMYYVRNNQIAKEWLSRGQDDAFTALGEVQ